MQELAERLELIGPVNILLSFTLSVWTVTFIECDPAANRIFQGKEPEERSSIDPTLLTKGRIVLVIFGLFNLLNLDHILSDRIVGTAAVLLWFVLQMIYTTWEFLPSRAAIFGYYRNLICGYYRNLTTFVSEFSIRKFIKTRRTSSILLAVCVVIIFEINRQFAIAIANEKAMGAMEPWRNFVESMKSKDNEWISFNVLTFLMFTAHFIPSNASLIDEELDLFDDCVAKLSFCLLVVLILLRAVISDCLYNTNALGFIDASQKWISLICVFAYLAQGIWYYQTVASHPVAMRKYRSWETDYYWDCRGKLRSISIPRELTAEDEHDIALAWDRLKSKRERKELTRHDINIK